MSEISKRNFDAMSYEEAVNYIEAVPRFTEKRDLSNTRELLRRLGHPEEKMDVIHVAGTNGKGSVCAFMASALQAAGRKTGLFTSPHLVDIRERFQINREMVTEDEFMDAFRTVMGEVGRMEQDGFLHPAYFELLFAMGMVMFEKRGIDVLVMETGLGGRLDATNSVAHPKICVITSISLDHMEYLGDTVAKIAGEKAGIIKEGVPVVFDANDPDARGVILAKAEEMHAPAVPVYRGMADIRHRTDKNIDFVLNNRYYDYRSVTVPFVADYQVMNCTLAMTALRVLDADRTIEDKVIIDAMAKTSWSGRMEPVLPGVVIDGAHNADGIEQFLNTVKRVQQRRPVSLLFAAVVEKDFESMIREICTEADFRTIVVTEVGGKRKVDPEVFRAIFGKYTKAPVYVEDDADRAFDRALALKDPDGILFCAGSLYLVGDIKAYLQKKQA